MNKLYFGLTAIFVFALVLTSCATPPTERMNMAQDAVLRAENHPGAVAYAPGILIRARDALLMMQAEADARRFSSAANFADEAISLAELAIAEGMLGAGRARDEAARLLDSLAGPLMETEAAVTTARNQALLLNHDAIGGEMEVTRQMYNDAVGNLHADNILEALAQGQIVRSNLININAQLTGAAQALSKK